MEPEQEHLFKLYSGSGIHSLPELNPKFIFSSSAPHVLRRLRVLRVLPRFPHYKSDSSQKCFLSASVLLPERLLLRYNSNCSPERRPNSFHLPESFCMPLRLLCCVLSPLSHLCTLYIDISQIHPSTTQLAQRVIFSKSTVNP